MKINSLSIKNFRGIKDLSIPFDKKSWVIHGRNGSGKSGIVDAIEFGLSGKVGRLAGEGLGSVNVKKHGPHVDSKETPQDAEVLISLNLNSHNECTVSRSCNSPSKINVEPENVGTNKIRFGSEIVLSRREILRFILAEPGKRSKEVQSLLKIEKLDEVRSAFQTLKNKVNRKMNSDNQEFDRAKNKLNECLDIDDFSKEIVLKVVNEHRGVLQLNKIRDLSDETKLNEGVKSGNVREFYNKGELQNLTAGIKSSLFDENNNFSNQAKQYLISICFLEQREKELNEINMLVFYEAGLSFITRSECPLCEKEWDQNELELLVKEKIKELSGVKEAKNKIDQQIQKIRELWKSLKSDIEEYEKRISSNKSLSINALEKIKSDITNLLSKSSNSPNIFKQTIQEMTSFGLNFNKDALEKEFIKLEEIINKLPEKSNEETSQEILLICQERLENYRASKRKYEIQKIKEQQVNLMLDKYNEITEGYLNNLYSEIELDLSKFYQIVNNDDEADFTGDLVANEGSLDLKVDFYNRGKFPPAAYHSEGHQDTMGLCLYLALMKKIFGSNFTLAVLDDVLLSVDESHKKSFCRLLKSEFPNTQFIITTHDKYWQKQMITEGLVTHATTFNLKNWSVNTGPCAKFEKNPWDEVDELISEDNIPLASAALRRYLEYIVDEISVKLTAKIARNPSGDYDLGELLIGVTTRYKELLKRAIKSARYWENQQVCDTLMEQEKRFEECNKKVKSEYWSINAMLHFNSWANMDQSAFNEVKEAYYNFIQNFMCDDCNTLLYVIPAKGASEIFKCDCGAKNYNLKSKS